MAKPVIPVLMKFGTGSWRDVIVARRSRKSSASFEAMVSLRELPATKSSNLLRKTLHLRRLRNRPKLSLWVRGQLTSLLGQSRQVAGSAVYAE